MKEKKFRAYDKERKYVVHGDAMRIEISHAERYILGNTFITQLNKWLKQLQEKFILMEFIGVKDTKGNDVYELDIAKVGIETELGFISHTAVVIWDSKMAVYTFQMLSDIGRLEEESFTGIIAIDEVIGNIFDNRELIDNETYNEIISALQYH